MTSAAAQQLEQAGCPTTAFATVGLRAGYGNLEVLQGLNIEVAWGELVLVIGHNGAGKSTIANAVLGLTDFTSGQINLAGRDLSRLPPSDRVLAGIGYVPQNRGLFPSFTVRHNLELGGYTLRSRHEVNTRVEQAFEDFPALAAKADIPAALLSGGQQRLLSIAMSLMIRPKVVFIDEPSAGLAPALVIDVMRHIDGIRRGNDASVVLIEQNVAAGLEIADRVYALRHGEVAAELTAADLRSRTSFWELL